ncbi:MAG: hypothetical protein Q9188_006628, partial [Gyalolechia gomerana]
MSDACQNQATIPDVVRTIAKSALQTVEAIHGVTVHLSHSSSVLSKYSRSGLKTAQYDMAASRPPTSSSILPDNMLAELKSLWDLQVIIAEVAHQYEVTIRHYWFVPTADHEHGVRAQHHNGDLLNRNTSVDGVESDPQDEIPDLNIHREVARFIESKPHASLDAMAFEASHVGLKAYESDKGSQLAKAIQIRVSDIESKRPARGTTYRVKSSWTFNAESYNNFQRARNDRDSRYGSHRVFLALGSNVGDRIGMIEQACVEMSRRGLKVLKTSSLYETEPMYKTDQPSFINGVCEIQTTLAPLELLDELKGIENLLGRVKTVENGPRTIDLDILLYGNQIVDHERLQIPHPRISERDFVLRPLC